jgi:predicted amidophosphoribosyltransferase
MALIKCKKCKKEISSTVKFCPHCGESNAKAFCRECGKEIGINDSSCQYCGYIVNQNNISNQIDTKELETYLRAYIQQYIYRLTTNQLTIEN